MLVNLNKQEVDKVAKETGLLKFRILSEMVDWTTDPEYLESLINSAEDEYNRLRNFAGLSYPRGRCRNILNLFQILRGRRCG